MEPNDNYHNHFCYLLTKDSLFYVLQEQSFFVTKLNTAFSNNCFFLQVYIDLHVIIIIFWVNSLFNKFLLGLLKIEIRDKTESIKGNTCMISNMRRH